MKLCTKFVVSGFIGIWDIVEGMPNFLGVTWPKQRPLSEMLYIRLMGRAKLKLCTNLELSDFTGFGDILEGMPKILGVTWPRPHPFQKYYTALFEFSGFIGFWDIVEGMPNFLGVTWPKPRPLSEIGYHVLVARDKTKTCTKFEEDPSVQERVMTFLVPIRYVILWPWPLTFWPWTVIVKFLVTSSNHTPTLSMLRRSKLELWCPQSGCYWQ